MDEIPEGARCRRKTRGRVRDQRGQDYGSSSEEEEEEKGKRRKERRKRPRYVGDSHRTEESSVTLGSESESNAQEPNGSTSDVFWSTDEEGPDPRISSPY